MTTASHPTLADLWRQARAWLAAALRDFRGPAQIATTFARAARAAIRARLALIEALVMKLLLIEAAQSSPACGGDRELPRKREEREGRVRSAPRPSVSSCALDSSPQSREHEDPMRPETWRVRFRLRMPRQQRASTASPPLHLTPRPEHLRAHAHARRLARRFEALSRVLADPRPAIAALARKLAARGAGARAIARRIALAHPGRASLGPVFATAMIFGHDASSSFPADTS
jgi:hypothetical protein